MKRHPKVLALILAGGEGNRMDVLTQERAKPALPYAGTYRLIDFALSNCAHSGIDDVWIIEQFEPHSLHEHLVNGRPWDLDRMRGGLRLLPPHKGSAQGGWHQGNADALHRNKRYIREAAPDLLLVLSADHIYKLDYRDVIEEHRQRGAEVTMVTTRVPLAEAGRFGTVRVDDEGRVTHFDYKPESPQSDIVTTEVFVYNASTLLRVLDELAGDNSENENGENENGEAEERDEEKSALQDFGHELLPELVSRGHARSYPLQGYWRDVGTIESYFASHMDLLAAEPSLKLDEARWPILTGAVQRLPALIGAAARIEDSLIAPGCRIRGGVARSVLSPGVVVEEGARVEDCVLLHDVTVEAGARLARAIVDEGARIGPNARIGEAGADIAVVGRRAAVAASAVVEAGARVPPDARK